MFSRYREALGLLVLSGIVLGLPWEDTMLNELRKIQKQCDEISFTIFGKKYNQLTPEEILKHKCFHITNLLAKVSAVCEKHEHELEGDTAKIVNEVVPDLLVYALQLANAYSVDLDRSYRDRIEFIVEKGKQYHAPEVYDADLHAALRVTLDALLNDEQIEGGT
jgi:hypothetical protein